MPYESDIELGKEYIDKHTGIKGRAIAIVFYENSCQRVDLEYEKDGDLKSLVFDATRLNSVETGATARDDKPGGDRPGVARARVPGR